MVRCGLQACDLYYSERYQAVNAVPRHNAASPTSTSSAYLGRAFALPHHH